MDIPNSCRKQGKRGNILASQPMHRTARKRLAGELLRYRSGDAALTIATMPAFRAPGSSDHAATTAAISPRSPHGFPWRTSLQTPPGIGAFRPPNPPRNMGGVLAPFSPRLITGGGGTKLPRLYRGGNPASNACMYRYRRDTESDTKPQFQPPLSVSIPCLIY